ncbi:cysteine--tRNA ligase [Candidatus Parcubacteria bacterium]|nr:MAG: cysteine--tRNA ligase [Candidatus Parcubacteria bacterium]
MWFQKLFQKLPFGHVSSLSFYNTLTKQKEAFQLPAPAKRVRMYNCGPTVYGVQHIGNLSMFVFTDILRRTLEQNGYEVKQVINITDVGHLSSDADAGEDKMTLGLKREKMKLTLENMRLLADKYAGIFIEDIGKLNIDTSRIQFPRASDHIPAQIAMIKTLEEKGYAYKIADGVYFDTEKFPRYGQLGGIDREGQKEGARVAVVEGKRNAADFALWKFSRVAEVAQKASAARRGKGGARGVSKNTTRAAQGTRNDADEISGRLQGWDSPWGKGYPGWHIECSAMARVCLGEKIDIHTGGIEHIPIHHNNEIAQSECATGKRPFSRFWLHRQHIQIDGGKIAKSQGNVVYLSEIIEKGFHPLALRYLFLGAHYRTPSNFSWEALTASQNALANLLSIAGKAVAASNNNPGTPPAAWMKKFRSHINDDLDTPGALAVLWDMTKDTSLSAGDLLAGIIEMDKVLGLNLHEPDELAQRLSGKEISVAALPADVKALVDEREAARASKEWTKADELREQIEKKGYTVKDTDAGVSISAAK